MDMKILVCSVCILLLPGCNGNAGAYSKLTLSDFIFKDDCPMECDGYISDPGESYPFSISSNPYLSSNPDFLDLFSSQLLQGDEIIATDVRTGLFSVIGGSSEIGLFGLEFITDTTALWAKEQLTNSNPDPARFKIYAIDKVIIQLWSDSPEDPCFNRISQKIENLVNS